MEKSGNEASVSAGACMARPFRKPNRKWLDIRGLLARIIAGVHAGI